MKFRESGMPEVELWNRFFEPEQVLREMEVTHHISNLIDIGCGYGTFIIPAAKIISGKVIGIDIDSEAIEEALKQIERENVKNIELLKGDITNPEFMNLFKKYEQPADYICLFNILHCEEPIILLERASELLIEGGKLGVTHWIYGETPRGPSLEIRPKPKQIIQWCESAGFQLQKEADLPPYHFGQVYEKLK